MKNSLFSFLVLFFSITLYGQNLIVNPEAELDPTTNGWIQLSGLWERTAEIAPQKGLYHFGAGVAPGTSELYQDTDVSSLASAIDAGNINFSFSGYVATWAGDDQARIIVEYRNTSNTILSSYDTGLQIPIVWTKISDTRVAIAGTRIVRIRLLSTRVQGNYSDGYFDNLELYSFGNSNTSNTFPLYGNIGIGTNNPDAKLAVNGVIHTKEVKVDVVNWPDYVFKNAYNLPSLKSTELYIKNQGHLPNIPQASLAEVNGVFLGEMSAKLLEKIEELTLYAIGQEHRIETLQNFNQTLEHRVDKLEKIVDKYLRTKEH